MMSLIEEKANPPINFNIDLKPGILTCVVLLILTGNLLSVNAAQPAKRIRPIQLHPDNPHYFLWRGKPTVLITSGEHYGAVLNRAFNIKYILKHSNRMVLI